MVEDPGSSRAKAAPPSEADLSSAACCRMCGIADGETPRLVFCRVVKVNVCDPCCVAVGGPYHDVCKTCPNGKPYWDSIEAEDGEKHLPEVDVTPYV